MEMIFKTVAFAVITLVCVVLIKQLNPELSIFVQLAGLFVLLMLSFGALGSIVDFINSFAGGDVIESSYITLLLKALAIAVTAKIGSDMCRDYGNGTLAFGVELAGKLLILSLVLPMLKNLVQITSGLLGKG